MRRKLSVYIALTAASLLLLAACGTGKPPDDKPVTDDSAVPVTETAAESTTTVFAAQTTVTTSETSAETTEKPPAESGTEESTEETADTEETTSAETTTTASVTEPVSSSETTVAPQSTTASVTTTAAPETSASKTQKTDKPDNGYPLDYYVLYYKLTRFQMMLCEDGTYASDMVIDWDMGRLSVKVSQSSGKWGAFFAANGADMQITGKGEPESGTYMAVNDADSSDKRQTALEYSYEKVVVKYGYIESDTIKGYDSADHYELIYDSRKDGLITPDGKDLSKE